MAKRAQIEVIEEDRTQKTSGPIGNACPVCGAPGGKTACEKCGWRLEELEPDFGATTKDPVSTIMHARLSYAEIKKELQIIKDKIEPLITNNKRFSELVEAMEAEIKDLRLQTGKKFVYRYNQGGWGEVDELDRSKLFITKKTATVDDINRQLMEITRLLKKYKK
jgi:hypothetical protein